MHSPDPRSALLVGNFPASGGFAPCVALGRALREAGWSVVETSRAAGRLPRLMDMTRTAWARRRHYSVAQVDVFSGLAFFWAEAVCRLLRQMDKPFVLTLHGGNLPEFARRTPGRVGRLLASAAAVTTPSPWLAGEMRRLRSDLVVLPNALQLEAFTYRERASPAPRLVWVRAFHETYDPSLAVRVLALVARDHPAATLTMLGRDKKDGSLEDAQKTAKELGVLSKVKFAGAVPNEEIPRHLDQHDVFLNTTRVDNTPVSVLEAMACGLLVVSTNVGGVPHLLTDATDALLVPPGDAEAMAAAVGRVLTEPELAARLSAAARARVLEMDWARVLPRWEALLLGAEAAVPAAAPAPTAAMGA